MKNIFKMKTMVILITIAAFSFYGCNTEELSTEADISTANLVAGNGHGKVVHRVSVGSNDVCEFLGLSNGCDANFSLAANMYEDGFVSGQWTDVFAGGNEGIRADIDCAKFGESGGFKYVILSGVITYGKYLENDWTGLRVVTLAVDYGVSNQNDYISFSLLANPNFDCNILTPQFFIDNNLIAYLSTGEVVIM